MNLQFNSNYDLIIIAFIIFIFVFYFSFKKNLFFKGFLPIIILRFLVSLLLIFLLLNPSLEKKGSINSSLPWHIYIDKSLSIKYHNQPSEMSYKSGIQKFLKKIKEKDIRHQSFSFGTMLDSLNDISTLDLDANSTNLNLIFNKISDNYQNNLAGIIIFTDGQVNQGSPIQEFYSNNDVPIYVVGVGDTNPMLDIAIQSVNSPPLSVKGEDVNIDVVVSSLGNINERVNVNLFDEKNKLIGSKLIKINGNEENKTIRFQIRPNKIGKNNFFVKCSALSDEINIQNNQQKITLHVMKDEYNIALVTGAPSYNTNVIKRYLQKQSNNKIDHFLMSSDNFNQKIKEFLEKKYEVIIFDNNPVLSNSHKWDSVARVFAKKIISHNSSFFIIPGPELDVSSINKYLKIIDLESKKIKENLIQKTEWEFSKSWFSLSSLNQGDNLSSNQFDFYPPQTPAFELLNNLKNKKVKVYASYKNEDYINPLLILGEKMQIRYAVWNSIDLSLFKNMLLDSDYDYLFESSMKKITNWLMKKGDSDEFIFRTNKNSYQHGESVILSGASSDLNDDFKINDGIVQLYSDNQYISSKPLFYDLNENIYKSKFWAPKPGEIDYIIKVNRGLDSYEVNRGTFRVQESHIELNKIYLNRNKLINLCESSGGLYKDWKEKDDLVNYVKDKNIFESYTSNFIFRYNYFYICLIFLLLSFEWFYRKKIGLI